MPLVNYIIKAEATNELGLGMVSRAFCLAEEMLSRDLLVTIVTNEPFGRKFFKNFPVEVAVIPVESSFEEELNFLRNMINEETILVLTDYKNINEYYGLLHPKKLILLADEVEPVTVPIDLFISSLLLKGPKSEFIKKSLCGLEYHFIKKEILNFKKSDLLETPKKVLLTMGGSDNKELTVSLMGMLHDTLKDCHFTVLLGTCSQRIGFTEKRLLGISDDIEINRNASKMEHQYRTFDFALCKGGVTAYELMYLGVPLLLVSTSDVQKEMLQLLHNEGAIVYAGHWNEITEENINSLILEICGNFDKRKSLSANAKQKIDGMGMIRIVNAIVDL